MAIILFSPGIGPEDESAIAKLMKDVETAEADAVGDYGEETIDAGGYAEVVRAVCFMSDASDAVKREVCRMLGVEYR